jgi:hypothetical protein
MTLWPTLTAFSTFGRRCLSPLNGISKEQPPDGTINSEFSFLVGVENAFGYVKEKGFQEKACEALIYLVGTRGFEPPTP